MVYVLSQSDASKLDDKFICVEVFQFERGRQDGQDELTDEAFYLLRKHRQKPVSTTFYNLGQCLAYIQPKNQFKGLTGSNLVMAMERISFAKNAKVWNNFL